MEIIKNLKELLSKGAYAEERAIDDPGTNPAPIDEGNKLQDVTKEK